MKEQFRLISQPKMENPALIVGWKRDVGKIAPRVIDFLNEKMGGRPFCEIKPVGFFSMGGVAIEEDVIRFPESKFYSGKRKDLVIFKSDQPQEEHCQFLNSVLDVAEFQCKIKEFYTISGTIAPIAHTNPRRILIVFNHPQFQKKLRGYGLEDMDFEGPPAISSYLLWVAERRSIPGVSLWPEIPFYLAAKEDPQAIKQTLSFLDQRFQLGLDLEDLDFEIQRQNVKIAQLRKENPEINKSIRRLERGLSLGEEEQMRLAKEVSQLLEKRG